MESVALFEMSFHMTELRVWGPDVIAFISELAVNRFDNFQITRAKQIVMVGPDGRFISDGIVFREGDEAVRVVGPPTASNWIQFNCETTGHRVECARNENMIVPRDRRDLFRFQLQGPNALALVQEASDGSLPEIEFFRIGEFQIAGKTVRALRHGMAGKPGFEIFGDWDDQFAVREAVEAIGTKFGLKKAGSTAFGTVSQESGWMPRPLPAIYDGTDMKGFRQWLPSLSFEAAGSLGGSFASDDIADYYVDPVEIGYENLIHYDHDFIGRDELRNRHDNQTRTKVTLVWDNDDVFAILRDSLQPNSNRPKYIDLPIPVYASFQADAVEAGGQCVGISQRISFSSNAGAILSQALVNLDRAKPSTKADLVWGEPNSRRTTVELHELRSISVTVAPVPYTRKSIAED